MSETEKHLKIMDEVANGRRVSLAYDVFAEVLKTKRDQAVKALIGAYNGGESASQVYNHVARLSAIEDLENTLKQTIKRGNRVGKEMLDEHTEQ